MGIININDDSFSGDGTLDAEASFAAATQMVADGATIIDIGAESARCNREAISVEEEISRLLSFLDGWNDSTARISVNTWRPEVVRAVLETGKVWLINDIGGLPSDENARLCAGAGAALLVMHTQGLPKQAHLDQEYEDVLQDVDRFFDEKIRVAMDAGLSREQLILDPGIDFAKQRDHNLALYQNLERLTGRGIPVLLPVSRKTVIGDVLGIGVPAERDAGTVASIVRGVRAGADIFRVHNVVAAVQAIRTVEAIG